MMSYPQFEEGDRSSKFPVTTLAARLVTMVSLVVAVVLIQTNDAKNENEYVTYKNFPSYKYMFYITLVGIAYTVLQLPLALYYMLRKKHLINRYGFLKFDFYADKVVVFMLATAAGAAFGATSEWTSKHIKWDDKLQNFFNLSYVAAAFVLVGCVASSISSIHSSLALTKT